MLGRMPTAAEMEEHTPPAPSVPAPLPDPTPAIRGRCRCGCWAFWHKPIGGTDQYPIDPCTRCNQCGYFEVGLAFPPRLDNGPVPAYHIFDPTAPGRITSK